MLQVVKLVAQIMFIVLCWRHVEDSYTLCLLWCALDYSVIWFCPLPASFGLRMLSIYDISAGTT